VVVLVILNFCAIDNHLSDFTRKIDEKVSELLKSETNLDLPMEGLSMTLIRDKITVVKVIVEIEIDRIRDVLD
jgi:hypothetical protein